MAAASSQRTQPLAERLRPTRLEDFIGQERLWPHIQALMRTENPTSLLLYGPPGCGKSTLALLMAKALDRPFLRVSAPEVGLAALRKKLASTEVLILDEVHRFSKAQQDFFLPLLESGRLILLATTTENPSFSITKQLISRLHILRLQPLQENELRLLANKGMQAVGKDLPEQSIQLLIQNCHGDARTLFNLIEYTSDLPEKSLNPETLRSVLPEILQRSDRNGDSHYELASALIKSIRGSDPDAALYYLAAMVEGGEDPRFICRRLILSASEDVGLADPQALPLAVSCFQSVDLVGMPEGFIPLAETVCYLALAPKSNSAYAGFLAAQKEIRENGLKPVPLHLRNPSSALHKKWGYGQGYKYPHAYPGAWIEQEYLPSGLLSNTFYQPKDQGMEPRLYQWLKSRKKNRGKK
ncbi:MAG: replication-associated recombination protein A [Desulfovermiculus sp.]